ncbi:MAG: class A beta-lactamase-related serine hydrolase [Mongoliibacter sp.]|uniref:serine hydrolase domain-containing protein n=1 Tax=Mongoliibacter sp. TaxID=2022438 RepID=UPI0012F2C684|nr:serine hydrolase domain-containing protein [Mongoliibacter sp.]TVP50781.1 MAG: class A beta-lactamase-related serine hydrolase [Mongoliibacter sp.]
MKQTFLLVLIFWLVSPIMAQNKIEDIHQVFNDAKDEDFSGVLLLAQQGGAFFEESAGFRHFEENTTLQSTDVFELASVSKQFTAMMVMMCQEKGMLKYDDLVDDYLDIPYSALTIRHLLTHTSGLPDYQEIMDKYWDKSKVADNDAILEYLNEYRPPMLFQPGERYEYSNTAYVFLASIVEKVSGEDFIVLSRKWIFEPLEMGDTDIRTLDEKAEVENFAAGHLKNEEGNYVNANTFHESDYTVWLGNRKGPGRVSSTAQDLLKWDQVLYTEMLVSRETLEEAFRPMKLNDGSDSHYGFGWDISVDEDAGKIVSHDGDNPGYRTKIIRLIDQQKTLILLNNNAHPFKDELLEKALDLLKKW